MDFCVYHRRGRSREKIAPTNRGTKDTEWSGVWAGVSPPQPIRGLGIVVSSQRVRVKHRP